MISDETFRKNEHIIKTKDFRRAYKEGASFRKKALVLYVVPNSGRTNRFGFVVSSRAVKLATRRNRIKRLLREAARKIKKDMKQGYDIVIIVKRDQDRTVGLETVKKTLSDAIKEAKLLR